MTERKGQFDPNETPEDVASLYSWANLQGAKVSRFLCFACADAREGPATRRAGDRGGSAVRRPAQPAEPQRTAEDPARDSGHRRRFDSPAAQPPPIPSPRICDDLAAISRGFAAPPQYRSTLPRTSPSPMREENYTPPRHPWPGADPNDISGRPAWLMPENAGTANPARGSACARRHAAGLARTPRLALVCAARSL